MERAMNSIRLDRIYRPTTVRAHANLNNHSVLFECLCDDAHIGIELTGEDILGFLGLLQKVLDDNPQLAASNGQQTQH